MVEALLAKGAAQMENAAWALGLLVPVLVAVFGYLVKVNASMWRKMDTTDKDLQAYKLYVAENYVSVRTFEKFETRVLAAIDDLKKMVREDIADHRARS